MTPFAEGIWIEIAPARILGMRLTVAMTVFRMPTGSLLLHSPLALTPERRSAVEALGPIEHIYAPSLYHGIHIGEWADAFPSAHVHAPADLIKDHPKLRIDRVLGSSPELAFANTIEEFHIDGFRLDETVLLHRPSRTLVVADLVHNVGQPQHWWTKFYTQIMGFYDRVALSRVIRWFAFSNRTAARTSIDELLTRPFDRLIMGHGTPLASGAKEAVAAAYKWLSSGTC